ncbi:hypothetical protein DFO77_12275 [Marinilabilia salmonicolor]|uniref:Uncharacterized protein n=1 Tax=Marinilabilia salmonicolor TaxID=989 RepID=A0A368UQI9_9BACT|nr:hypothetical protein DFO77_12275 [Marinilabilia salmonicolor]
MWLSGHFFYFSITHFPTDCFFSCVRRLLAQLFWNHEFLQASGRAERHELNEFMHCGRLLQRNYGLSADGKDEHRLLVIGH